jgi:hypothetical protein
MGKLSRRWSASPWTFKPGRTGGLRWQELYYHGLAFQWGAGYRGKPLHWHGCAVFSFETFLTCSKSHQS